MAKVESENDELSKGNSRPFLWILFNGGRWLGQHPALLSIFALAYFNLLGLYHINNRIPLEFALENGWLSIEDIISVGIALPEAWYLLALIVLFAALFAAFEHFFNYIIFRARKSKKIDVHAMPAESNTVNIRVVMQKRYLAVGVLALFVIVVVSVSSKEWPWPYAGVVTTSRVIYGDVPHVDLFESRGYAIANVTLAHALSLRNWVIFVAVTDEQAGLRYLKNDAFFIVIPSGSIEALYLEDRQR